MSHRFFKFSSRLSTRVLNKNLGRAFLIVLVCVLSTASNLSIADDARPAFLGIKEARGVKNTFDVTLKVPTRAETYRLPLTVVFDSKTTELAKRTALFADSNYYQQWQVHRPLGLPGMTLHIEGLSKSTTEVLTRVEYTDGTSITTRLTSDQPDFLIPAKPTWGQTARTYLFLGVEHILLGLDHLLFVLVLLLLVKSIPKLVTTITAFTVAHSITLILASINVISVPIPPIEVCIALSIVFVATEIIHGQQGTPGFTARSPWLVAFVFGLLHGLGFAAALGEIGLPQNAVPLALLVFNVGVELGQLAFVFAILMVSWLVRKLTLKLPQWSFKLPAYAIGSLASFWVFERASGF